MDLILRKFIALTEAYITKVGAVDFTSTTTEPKQYKSTEPKQAKPDSSNNTDDYEIGMPESDYFKSLTDVEKKQAEKILKDTLINKKNINIKYDDNSILAKYILESLVAVYQKSSDSSYKSFLAKNIESFLDALSDNNVRRPILIKTNNLIFQTYPDNVFDLKNIDEKLLEILRLTIFRYLPSIIDAYNSSNGQSPHFIKFFVTSISRRFKDSYVSFKQFQKKQNQKISKEQNIDKGILYNILKDPEKSKRFKQANNEIKNNLKGKIRLVFDLFTSGFEIDDIQEEFPNDFSNIQQLKDIMKAIKKSSVIPEIYKKYGFTSQELNIPEWGFKTFKQDKTYEKKMDNFNGLFEQKLKLRLLIREQIEKLSENWYDEESFDSSDIDDILGGSNVEQSAFADMKKDPSFTEPITEPGYEERGKLTRALMNKDSEENIKDVNDYERFKEKEKQMKNFSIN